LKIECATVAQMFAQTNGQMHCPGLVCTDASNVNTGTFSIRLRSWFKAGIDVDHCQTV